MSVQSHSTPTPHLAMSVKSHMNLSSLPSSL